IRRREVGHGHPLRREAIPRLPIRAQRANSSRDPALRRDPRLPLSRMISDAVHPSLRLRAPSPQLSLRFRRNNIPHSRVALSWSYVNIVRLHLTKARNAGHAGSVRSRGMRNSDVKNDGCRNNVAGASPSRIPPTQNGEPFRLLIESVRDYALITL